MSLADYISLNIGQINQTGDPNALFLKVFSGEVLKAFKMNCVTEPLVQKRSITHGKSAQFPVTGWLQSHYHTPGQLLTGQQGVQAEKIIVVDDLLVADAFIANIEEAKNHYDIRSIYSTEAGESIARKYDNKNIIKMIQAARAAANLSSNAIPAPAAPVLSQSANGALAGGPVFVKITYVTVAGETLPSAESTITLTANNVLTVSSPAPFPNVVAYNVYASATTGTETLQTTTPVPVGFSWTEPTTGLTNTGRVVPTASTAAGPNGTNAGTLLARANVDTDAPTLRTALIDATVQLDKNNVTKEGRFALLKPDLFGLLQKDVTYGYIGNQFFGGEGGIASGKLPMINGVPIFVSNNFPSGVVNSVPGEQSNYAGDYTKTRAIVSHRSAVGVVNLLEIATEMEYQVSRQGTLMVAKKACGVDTLRPEAAVEIAIP